MDMDSRNIYLVGTNGRRLHYASLEANHGQSGWTALIDAETMKRMTKLPAASTDLIYMSPCNHCKIDYVSWRIGNIEGFTLPMDTPFPEWKKVIPVEDGNLIELSASDLAGAVERLAPIARSDDGRDMIVLRGNGILNISARAESMGTGDSKLACDLHEGKDLRVALNYGFLLDVLKLHKKDQVRVTYGGELGPVMIRSVDDDTRSSILMPVRLPE
jgi:DNA polymerase-3 subunit beta